MEGLLQLLETARLVGFSKKTTHQVKVLGGIDLEKNQLYRQLKLSKTEKY